MTYAVQHRALGALPAGWSRLPLQAQLVDIKVRAASVRALAEAMSAEIRRVDRSVRVASYESVLSTLQSLGRQSLSASLPVQVVRGAVIFGLAQMQRLAAAAEAAADSTVVNTGKFTEDVVPGARSVESLRLAAEALGTAQEIQSVVLRAIQALASQAGTSGVGGLQSATYALGVGLLFGAVTGGATVPVGMLAALYLLFADADNAIGDIARWLGRLPDALVDTIKDAGGKIAEGAGEAVGTWLKFVLIAGTVIGGGYVAWNLWLSKRAASRLA